MGLIGELSRGCTINRIGVVNKKFDIVVIGGGHAGVEAAHAGVKLGMKTALITMDAQAIARMSCNPAIGGVAKGQIVRDVDALGGLMGVFTDKTGIQFRMLNDSKGPAVWGPRAQADMDYYSRYATEYMHSLEGLDIIEGELASFEKIGDDYTLTLSSNEQFQTKAIIITAGTFLDALMHVGDEQTVGGRVGERASVTLAHCIQKAGIQARRLKTGTPARLKASSINFSQTEIQHGDSEPFPFSSHTEDNLVNKATCWIVRTTKETHDILRSGFDRSPMFTGVIKGLGPRYCPSIEDKVSRFPDRDSHQLFLEPEGLDNERIYLNGFSSSLPKDVQDAALRSLPGFKNVEVIRYGYAVEYDAIYATQLQPTLECKDVSGLYFAGQVNGTSGYEEAAGQGLIAGINAALKIKGEEPFILGRSESYIGVMVDDLVTLDIDEPYRMFTSRAEYRLFLRQDNAENRLTKIGYTLGMVEEDHFNGFQEGLERIASARKFLENTLVTMESVNPYLEAVNSSLLKESVRAITLVKRPHVEFEKVLEITEFDLPLSRKERLTLYADILYMGFYERQEREIEKQKRLETMRFPEGFDFMAAEAISMEARHKLTAFKPMTLGQASKVGGVRPPDISALIYYIEKGHSAQ